MPLHAKDKRRSMASQTAMSLTGSFWEVEEDAKSLGRRSSCLTEHLGMPLHVFPQQRSHKGMWTGQVTPVLSIRKKTMPTNIENEGTGTSIYRIKPDSSLLRAVLHSRQFFCTPGDVRGEGKLGGVQAQTLESPLQNRQSVGSSGQSVDAIDRLRCARQ